MIEVNSDDTPEGHHDGHSVLLVRLAPLHRPAVVLPVLDSRAGAVVPADRRGGQPGAGGRRSPARKTGHRAGLRAGHLLEVLAPLDRRLPARLLLPGRRRRPAAPA